MKVLIIQKKMIGDVLASSILFEALKAKYPDAVLHYVINSHTFPVVEHNPYIDKLVFFTPEMKHNKGPLWHFIKSIRKEQYDVVVDVYSKPLSILMTLFSGAKTRISKYKYYTYFIYNHPIIYANKARTNASLAIENRLKLLEPLGIEGTIIKPKIYLTQEEIEVSNAFLKQYHLNLSKPLFMISVLGSDPNKTYPFPYMAEVIDTIVAQTQGQVLFNYIPKQINEAKAIYDLCKKETQNQIYFDVYGENLRMFLAITKHCTALIGNEGGAVNMAKALDIPTFTIFSPGLSKENWNMFEDGKNHVSVHLQDYINYSKNTLDDAKKNPQPYYLKFKPEYIIPTLTVFLKAFPNGL
ncbi:glycosyltransferase family 9 protein [Gelidibacter salicanalis]|uniref:Glycosyltransferase family 9 protein n=1 Tax=Gelidibacter salicanalis TaxID=291193 RepID=A0A934NH75_9FLAO|nr:glycosyltransferase family 9 protein [Gelidibacter salicanalis]MBJ7879343.1 glycosyltransferase family 9 protein [Gelidibacter salicanalis]